jgi:hypothetical protein
MTNARLPQRRLLAARRVAGDLYIGVLALHNNDGWRIGHYQASAGITSRSNSSIPDRS